jgi:hypothetical protein
MSGEARAILLLARSVLCLANTVNDPNPRSLWEERKAVIERIDEEIEEGLQS